MQLDLFQDDEIEVLHISHAELKSQFGKLRRHYFAERGELRGEISMLKSEVFELRQMLLEIIEGKKSNVVKIPFFKDYIEVSN